MNAPFRSRFVYFVEAEGMGLIKIGMSVCPWHRMRAIAVQTGRTLKMLGCTPQRTLVNERSLHLRFKRQRASGEWFRDCPEIREFIRACCGDAPPVEQAEPIPSVLYQDGNGVECAAYRNCGSKCHGWATVMHHGVPFCANHDPLRKPWVKVNNKKLTEMGNTEFVIREVSSFERSTEGLPALT